MRNKEEGEGGLPLNRKSAIAAGEKIRELILYERNSFTPVIVAHEVRSIERTIARNLKENDKALAEEAQEANARHTANVVKEGLQIMGSRYGDGARLLLQDVLRISLKGDGAITANKSNSISTSESSTCSHESRRTRRRRKKKSRSPEAKKVRWEKWQRHKAAVRASKS